MTTQIGPPPNILVSDALRDKAVQAIIISMLCVIAYLGLRFNLRFGADNLALAVAEIGALAGQQALASAGRAAAEVDLVIAACANFQRPYPAIAIEIQDALGVSLYIANNEI